MPSLLAFLGRYRTTERATTRATFFRQGVFGMADYLVKRDGFWHFVRRVPKHYETTDQHGIVRETTKVRVADDPRAVRARKVAAGS
jgi:hypothetical protein